LYGARMTADSIDAEGPARKRLLVDDLYRRYSVALRSFLARRRLSREDVADIVQETFSRVLKARNIEEINNPKAFLFQVATNVRLNAEKHRRYGIEQAVGAFPVEIASEDPGPFGRLKSEQELEIVRAALEELQPQCRQAFVMNRFEHMTFRQIAAELGLSVSMIEKHVSHAIAHMRARLDAAPPRKARR
jgi:RNA polymerase sigma factor (sigma-70 family)